MFTADSKEPLIKASRGFTLIEIVTALGLCAFALIALLGLMQVSIQTHQESQEESMVLNLSDWILRDIRQGPRTPKENEPPDPKPVSTTFEIPLVAGEIGTLYLSENGKVLEQTDADARFQLRVSLSADMHRVHLAFFTRAQSNPAPLFEMVASLKSYDP